MNRMASTVVACSVTLCVLFHASDSLAAGKSEAMVRFEKGVKLYKAGDFVGSLVEFKEAYEAEPNYKVRYNIGMSLFNLHRYVEAQAELTAYLAEGGKEIPDGKRTEVQSLLFEIGSYIGTLVVTSAATGAILTIDGEKVGPLPLADPLQVDVGEHVVLVEAPGHLSSSQKVSVAGGKQVGLDVALTPSAPLAAAVPGPLAGPADSQTSPPVETAPGSTGPTIQASGAISPSGATCSVDSDCPPSSGCHAGECMSHQKWSNLKHNGKNLIVPGWVFFSFNLVFIALTGGLGSLDEEFIAMMGAPAFVSMVISIPLLVVGYRYRKLAWKKKVAGLDEPPVPWLAPIDGGIAMGIASRFCSGGFSATRTVYAVGSTTFRKSKRLARPSGRRGDPGRRCPLPAAGRSRGGPGAWVRCRACASPCPARS